MNRLNQIAIRLWREESGSTSVVALILVTTIVCVGAVAGLATFRNQIVQEFGDMGVAIDNLDHSFSYTIEVDTDDDGTVDTVVATAMHVDDDVNNDGAADTTNLVDPVDAAPACLDFSIVPPGE